MMIYMSNMVMIQRLKHSPTLNTVLMVESVIKNSKSSHNNNTSDKEGAAKAGKPQHVEGYT